MFINKIFLLIYFIAIPSFAALNGEEANKNLTEALVQFKKGAYQKSIDHLNVIKNDPKHKAMASYLKGVCYNKLQNYEEAIINFRRAISFKSDSPDLYYELGQSLYANQEFEKARSSFRQSIRAKYREAASLYYAGYISQTLEEFDKAKDYYQKISTSKDLDIAIHQASEFQMGEVLLAMKGDQVDHRYLEDIIFPQMNKAKSLDSKSQTSGEIEARIDALRSEYKLDEMNNGRKIKKVPWRVRFAEDISYDSNVTLTPDDVTTTGTDKASGISKTSFSGNYQWIVKKMFIIKPELGFDYDYHTDQSTVAIHTNDKYVVSPKLYNTWEHTFLNEKASLIFDLEYSYQKKDRNQDHNLVFQDQNYSVAIGEKFRLFPTGDLTLKYKYKLKDSYTQTLDSITHTISANQAIALKSGSLIIGTLSVDLTDVEDTSNSTNSYLIRGDYVIPEFYKGFGLSPALSVSALDTKEQSATRGTEWTINPSVKGSRVLWDLVKADLEYAFTKNTSKSDANEYSKHVVTLSLEVSWN